jgi:exodeoxyribonuclease V beta subunit
MKLSDISIEPVSAYSPFPGQAGPLNCRAFSGSIDRQWGISSFSSMVSIRRHAEELPDRDAISLPDDFEQMQLQESDEEEERFDIFSFPKGAKAGTFLHDLLEHLDFTEEGSTIRRALVADKLRAHGFEFHWLDTICSMIDRVLSVPLDPEWEELRLSRIQKEDRLNELEFYFPLKTLSPERLRCVFQEHSGEPIQDFPEIIGQLQFAPTKGFMRGFIDLVFQWRTRFYLVDWKSNFLGSQINDYSQESLAREMGKEFYFLQYYIYTLALDQYLRLRIPGYRYQTNFGGIYYIFLRGVDPAAGPDFGIYRDLPSSELIASLKKELMDVR